MKNIIKTILIGNENEINKRLLKLYGAENNEDKNKKIVKKNKLNVILTIALISFLIMFIVVDDQNLYQEKVKDGVIVTIDSNEAGTVYFNLEYAAKNNSEGETEETKGQATIGISNIKESESESENKEDKKAKIDNQVEVEILKFLDRIEEEGKKGQVILPNKISENIEMNWNIEEQDYTFLFMVVLIFSVAFIWNSRYAEIKKMEKEARNSVVGELPNFINKLLLLLNGGMIFSEAFGKIVEDYEIRNTEKKSYFYNQLSIVKRNQREINKPLIDLLLEFSKNTEIREFIRVISIIKEENKVGGNIKDKLKNESQMLWLLRKKEVEEKSKRAETEMTFPLVILLIVMMVVTISPTFLEL